MQVPHILTSLSKIHLWQFWGQLFPAAPVWFLSPTWFSTICCIIAFFISFVVVISPKHNSDTSLPRTFDLSHHFNYCLMARFAFHHNILNNTNCFLCSLIPNWLTPTSTNTWLASLLTLIVTITNIYWVHTIH